MFVNGSGQNELSLPTFGSRGSAVSEEKIKMWKVSNDRCQVMAKAHFVFGKVS